MRRTITLPKLKLPNPYEVHTSPCTLSSKSQFMGQKLPFNKEQQKQCQGRLHKTKLRSAYIYAYITCNFITLRIENQITERPMTMWMITQSASINGYSKDIPMINFPYLLARVHFFIEHARHKVCICCSIHMVI